METWLFKQTSSEVLHMATNRHWREAHKVVHSQESMGGRICNTGKNSHHRPSTAAGCWKWPGWYWLSPRDDTGVLSACVIYACCYQKPRCRAAQAGPPPFEWAPRWLLRGVCCIPHHMEFLRVLHAWSASSWMFGDGTASFRSSFFRLQSTPNLRSRSPTAFSKSNCPSAVKLVINFGSPRGNASPRSVCQRWKIFP